MRVDIVVAEDTPFQSHIVDAYLRQRWSSVQELSIRQVPDFASLRNELGKALPDVLILDLGLGDSKGPETLHRVQQEWPGLPTVVLTGTLSPEEAAQMLGRNESHVRLLLKGELGTAALPSTIAEVLATRWPEERLAELISQGQ